MFVGVYLQSELLDQPGLVKALDIGPLVYSLFHTHVGSVVVCVTVSCLLRRDSLMVTCRGDGVQGGFVCGGRPYIPHVMSKEGAGRDLRNQLKSAPRPCMR